MYNKTKDICAQLHRPQTRLNNARNGRAWPLCACGWTHRTMAEIATQHAPPRRGVRRRYGAGDRPAQFSSTLVLILRTAVIERRPVQLGVWYSAELRLAVCGVDAALYWLSGFDALLCRYISLSNLKSVCLIPLGHIRQTCCCIGIALMLWEKHLRFCGFGTAQVSRLQGFSATTTLVVRAWLKGVRQL